MFCFSINIDVRYISFTNQTIISRKIIYHTIPFNEISLISSFLKSLDTLLHKNSGYIIKSIKFMNLCFLHADSYYHNCNVNSRKT